MRRTPEGRTSCRRAWGRWIALTGAVLIAHRACAASLVLTGAGVSEAELNAATTLAADLRERVPTEPVRVAAATPEQDWSAYDHVFLLGTAASQPWLGSDAARARGVDTTPLAPEAHLVQVLPPPTAGAPDEPTLVVLRGGDVRGVHYAASRFAAELLDIDPLAYWTGRDTVPVARLVLPAFHRLTPAPVFPLRGYFDNDNDLLANFKGRKLIVEFDLWRELIDSLVRLGYNYVDLHDALGRPEYYLRDYYREMTDYHSDLELVEQVIDYAHRKGMLVQIPMYLGWEFKHIGMDEVCLSQHHDRWMEVYDFYLNESPLGKADLFLARPRHPIYDWPYQCAEEEAAGIAPGPLLTRMFAGLRARVLARNPQARLVCDLWMEGLPMWRSGAFAPDRSITMMWADHGFADFPEGWPEDTRGYAFGLYLHAGVWKNQVVQDPYPARIQAALAEAQRRGLTANLLVNGQNFKGFLLNLEASARAAWDPAGFDADVFLDEWATRYFGAAAAPDVIAALHQLHAAHGPVTGFRDVMKDSTRVLNRLQRGKATAVDLAPAREALAAAEAALRRAEDARPLLRDGAELTFADQVTFPIAIFAQNLRFNLALARYSNARLEGRAATQVDALGQTALRELTTLRTQLTHGSGWSKWPGWYAPENFRIHTPPPELGDLAALLAADAP